MAQAGLDGLILLVWQFEGPQPVAALDPEQVRHRWAALQAAHQHGVHLVLDPGARADELLAAGEAPAHAGDPLRRHPHRLELAGPQQLGQRARVEPVGLRPGLRDARVPGRDHDDLGHVGLQPLGDLPRAAGHLQRDPVGRHETVDQRRDPVRRGRHPSGRVHLALLADRDLDEVKVHIQPDTTAQRSKQLAHLGHSLTSYSV